MAAHEDTHLSGGTVVWRMRVRGCGPQLVLGHHQQQMSSLRPDRLSVAHQLSVCTELKPSYIELGLSIVLQSNWTRVGIQYSLMEATERRTLYSSDNFVSFESICIVASL